MRRLSVLILFLVLVSSLPALDSIFIGIEPEINAYSREKVAFGGAFSIGFGLNRHFSLGVKTGFYHNFDTVNTLEALGFFRYNIPIKFPGLYVQAELGAATLFEDGDAYPAFLGGLSAGWRFNFGRLVFLEPYVRGGYPHIWGAGLMIGLNFNSKSKKEE